MNKHLVQLIDLAEVDKSIDSFIPKEDEINAGLNRLVTKQNENSETMATLNDNIEENKLKVSKSEAHLAELKAKLDDIDAKSAAVRNEKEMKSLQLEEEIAKEQITFANDEIARIDTINTAKESEIEVLKTENSELDIQIDQTKTDNVKALEELEKEKKVAFKSKEKMVGEVPQKVLSFYQKVRRWAANTTVVPVWKQSCKGCYMKLNDRVYSEVIRSEEINTCPSCGRILYMPKEETSEVVA